MAEKGGGEGTRGSCPLSVGPLWVLQRPAQFLSFIPVAQTGGRSAVRIQAAYECASTLSGTAVWSRPVRAGPWFPHLEKACGDSTLHR